MAEVKTINDTVLRALELANDDWTESEAAAELSRVTAGNLALLDATCQQMLRALAAAALVDVRGVRATRIVLAALRQPKLRPPVPLQRNECAPWAWPDGR